MQAKCIHIYQHDNDESREFNKHIINNVIKINFVQYFSDRWSESVYRKRKIYIYVYVINNINKYIFYLLAPITSAPRTSLWVLCVECKTM